MRTSLPSIPVRNDSNYIYFSKGEKCLLYLVKDNLSKDQFLIRTFEIPNFKYEMVKDLFVEGFSVTL